MKVRIGQHGAEIRHWRAATQQRQRRRARRRQDGAAKWRRCSGPPALSRRHARAGDIAQAADGASEGGPEGWAAVGTTRETAEAGELDGDGARPVKTGRHRGEGVVGRWLAGGWQVEGSGRREDGERSGVVGPRAAVRAASHLARPARAFASAENSASGSCKGGGAPLSMRGSSSTAASSRVASCRKSRGITPAVAPAAAPGAPAAEPAPDWRRHRSQQPQHQPSAVRSPK